MLGCPDLGVVSVQELLQGFSHHSGAGGTVEGGCVRRDLVQPLGQILGQSNAYGDVKVCMVHGISPEVAGRAMQTPEAPARPFWPVEHTGQNVLLDEEEAAHVEPALVLPDEPFLFQFRDDAIQRGAAMQVEFAGRFVLVEGCFSDMATLIKNLPPKPHGLRNGAPEKLDGAAFDLGVCSTQLDQADRGFSFRSDGPLDMRMSKSGTSAADVVMQSDAHDLGQILWEYGEERASRRIARAIVAARERTPITSTKQLADCMGCS